MAAALVTFICVSLTISMIFATAAFGANLVPVLEA